MYLELSSDQSLTEYRTCDVLMVTAAVLGFFINHFELVKQFEDNAKKLQHDRNKIKQSPFMI